ncbi:MULTISPECIES: ABC transporter permease [Listeria]|uniref:ABC transporter permease n=1 Tax=Listeria TaxID=1637 RepID=UPI000B58960E|nr:MULTISPECIES: ABC transporter permease [Listeria]
MKIKIANSLIGILGLLLIWELLYLFISSPVIPAPLATCVLFFEKIPELIPHTLMSLYRIVVAILVSLLIGIPLGIFIGANQLADKWLSPILYYIYPIPKVAFLPVFMILYGLGDLSKIMLVIWIIIFQIILSARDGVKQMDPNWEKIMFSFQATPFMRFKHLLLPAISPHIISGLRIAIGISLASLFFAENYATTYGLGYYIMNAWSVIDYPDMFCGILALAFLGFFLFKLTDLLGKRLIK